MVSRWSSQGLNHETRESLQSTAWVSSKEDEKTETLPHLHRTLLQNNKLELPSTTIFPQNKQTNSPVFLFFSDPFTLPLPFSSCSFTLNRVLFIFPLPLPRLPLPADGAGRACAWVVAISIVLNGSRRFVVVSVVDGVKTAMVMSGLPAGCFLFVLVVAGRHARGE